MKFIQISVLGAGSAPVIFLISPATTAGSILDQLKIEDHVLFPPTDPASLYYHTDVLHDKVQSGDRLIAATLPEATEAYRRSRAYH